MKHHAALDLTDLELHTPFINRFQGEM